MPGIRGPVYRGQVNRTNRRLPTCTTAPTSSERGQILG